MTFWSVADGDSWLSNWPITGRASHGMRFDHNYTPKTALEVVPDTKLLAERSGRRAGSAKGCSGEARTPS